MNKSIKQTNNEYLDRIRRECIRVARYDLHNDEIDETESVFVYYDNEFSQYIVMFMSKGQYIKYFTTDSFKNFIGAI